MKNYAQNQPGPIERKARKYTAIGAIIMFIGSIIFSIALKSSFSEMLLIIIEFTVVGALYGFGICFGLRDMYRSTLKGAAVAGEITFWLWIKKMLRRDEHMSIMTFPLIMLSIGFGLTIGWIKGVFKGVKTIKEERRSVAGVVPPTAKTAPSKRKRHPKPSASPCLPKITLSCTGGEYTGAVLNIKSGDKIILGTDPKFCNLVFNDKSISRQHCSIICKPNSNTAILQDTSTNGTYLSDGTRLKPHNPTELTLPCKIFFGNKPESFEIK